MAKIAVIGATGFAGKAVCSELERAGYSVGKFSPSHNDFDLIELASASRAMAEYNPTHIVNCAAHVGGLAYVDKHQYDMLDANSVMALNLYNIAVRIKCKIVNPIANCGYPGSAEIFVEDEFQSSPVHSSVLGYGFSRRLLLTAAQTAKKQYGIDSINLLVSNMYGPGDNFLDIDKLHALNALIAKFIVAKKRGYPEVEVLGTGAPVREWLYVNDFAKLVRLAIENNIVNQPVNLAQNYGLSIAKLAEMIKAACQYDGAIVYNTSFANGAPRKLMDNKLFSRLFPGFLFTDLESGIANTVSYARLILD